MQCRDFHRCDGGALERRCPEAQLWRDEQLPTVCADILSGMLFVQLVQVGHSPDADGTLACCRWDTRLLQVGHLPAVGGTLTWCRWDIPLLQVGHLSAAGGTLACCRWGAQMVQVGHSSAAGGTLACCRWDTPLLQVEHSSAPGPPPYCYCVLCIECHSVTQTDVCIQCGPSCALATTRQALTHALSRCQTGGRECRARAWMATRTTLPRLQCRPSVPWNTGV